jgi:putative tryptophan/tyrosine transport system substrate-binding protein
MPVSIGRRQLIAAVAGGVAAWPLAARAQTSGKVPRVGFFGISLNAPPPLAHYQSFLAQLNEQGFRDGQNVIVQHQAFDEPRGPFLAAAELMRSQPDLIVALGPEIALQAVLGASGFIPIIIIAINFDPIERGYVKTLARPGGNITGVVFLQLELAQKQVELLTQAFPGWTQLSVLFDAQSADQFGAAAHTAKALGLQVQPVRLENPPYDFDAAFASAAAVGSQMALVLSSGLFVGQRARIAEIAIGRRLPTMFINRVYVESGGLFSYGVNFAQMYRRGADYVAKILKGAKPGDLPVEQASKFELVVNLKTAKAIGIELPTGILVRADQVIE